MNSRRAVDIVVRRAATKRAGHAGTLDPLASGVLVVCLGWATRLVPFIQDRRKTYAAQFLFGQSSDTDDSTGTIVEVRGAPVPPRAEVEAALRNFTGQVMQVPPRYSAVHVAGRRAHTLARRGQAVAIDPRPVEIHRIDIVSYEYPRLELDIECGSGTYVRSIARDLGSALGCGGLMSGLLRRSIGEFTVETAVSIDDLGARPIDEFVLPPLTAVAHLARHVLTPFECVELLRGRPLPCQSQALPATAGLVALVDAAGQLQALAEHDPLAKLLRPRQVFAAGCSE